jgi:hypothetical protein
VLLALTGKFDRFALFDDSVAPSERKHSAIPVCAAADQSIRGPRGAGSVAASIMPNASAVVERSAIARLALALLVLYWIAREGRIQSAERAVPTLRSSRHDANLLSA